MTELRPELPEPTSRIAALKVDKRGYPVPFFVDYVDGEPDHRLMDGRKVRRAIIEELCWICGGPLGSRVAFVIGPMCAINRISAEPPSHRDCAEYSVKACPFLSRPHAKRRESGMPEEAEDPAGQMILRNPRVTLIWIVRSNGPTAWKPFRSPRESGGDGVLFNIGEPEAWYWYREGREATREEVMESIETGLPALTAAAQAQGVVGEVALHANIEHAMRYVPAVA